jgi:hypothetical protein
VECKGNQTSYSESVHQLSSGAEQVHCIQFTNNRPTVSLVIASNLSGNGEVYVIDPPPGEDESKKSNSRQPMIVEKEHRRLIVNDPDRFGRELARSTAAQLLTYSGDFESAYRAVMAEEPAAEKPFMRSTAITTRENDAGVFEGHSSIQSLPDGTQVTVFKGIEAGLREQLIAAPDSADHFDESPVAVDEPFVILPNRRRSIASVSSAGTILEISF